MKDLNKETVGATVANDYRTARVFSKYGIDFCCKGGKTIAEACALRQIDPAVVEQELDQIKDSPDSSETNYESWSIDLLADYIENTHHRYVEARIPLLMAYLDKVCRVHGESHPELFTIRDLFLEGSLELTHHMQKEEHILFPYIREMMRVKNESCELEMPVFLTVNRPLKALMDEHEAEGDRFRKIADLSNEYNPPPTACTTYRVMFSMLKEFEDDLHLHIHLENNLLFPGSIDVEKQLLHRN